MAVVGTGYNGAYPLLKKEAYDSVSGTYAGRHQIFNDLGGMQWGWRCFFEQFLGITYREIPTDVCQGILETEAYKEMPVFPYEGCTGIIHDVMVVKLTSDYDGKEDGK